MIDESGPWRDELRKSATRLKRWDTQQRWTERTYFLAERNIMMGAYSIRRLIDPGKSSSQLPKKTLVTQRFESINHTPRVLDRFSPERFYDIERPVNTQLTVGSLCNQIIHSFVFQFYRGADSTTSVLFVSDRDRGKHLNGIRFKLLADLFDYVGREDVIKSSREIVDENEKVTNMSNHDAVESGHAYYLDDGHVFVGWKHRLEDPN